MEEPRGPVEPPEWDCQLMLDYPDSTTTRVNWGESIKDISVEIHSRAAFVRDISVTLELQRPKTSQSNRQRPIIKKTVDVSSNTGRASFGDWQIIRGTAHDQQIQVEHQGKWQLVARVQESGHEVARASRPIFVHEDPPERLEKDFRLSIKHSNLSSPSLSPRYDWGNILGLHGSVTNMTPEDTQLELTVSLGAHMLTEEMPLQVSGTAAGDDARPVPGIQESLIVTNPSRQATLLREENEIALPAGKHTISADLLLAGTDEIVAHGDKTIYVEQDPPGRKSWLPFDIKPDPNPTAPRWRLELEAEDEWVQYYSERHPVYTALADTGNVRAFLEDTALEALLEWAIRPLAAGQTDNFEMLRNRSKPPAWNEGDWLNYQDMLDFLASDRRALASSIDKVRLAEHTQTLRDCVAIMLKLYGGLR